MNTFVFASVVTAIIIATNVIAFWRKGGGTFLIYSADPNAHGIFSITMSMLGTIVGGGMFLAVGQIGYEAGVTGYVFGFASAVGLITIGLFSARLRAAMDQEKASNIIDLLQKRYSRRVAVIFTCISAIMYFFLLAGQFVALFNFAAFSSRNLPHIWVPWVLVSLGGLTMFLYPIVGGLRKDIITDIFQMILISCVTVYIIINFILYPPSAGVLRSLPVEHLTGNGYGFLFLLAVVLFWPPHFIVRMDVWQRIRAAKSDKAILIALVCSGIGAFLFYGAFTSIGMWAYTGGITEARHATLGIILAAISDPVALGLVIGAFFAAVLSSADTFINNTSLFFTRLLWGPLWDGACEDNRKGRALLIRSRIVAVLIVMGSATIAWVSGSLVDLFVAAFSLLLMFLPMILGTFIEPWRSERGAFYSSLIGVSSFIPLFFFWDPKMAFAPSVILSIATYAYMCRFRRIRPNVQQAPLQR